ncbi:MAG: hypothetical protein L6R40_003529 [Gallowayella cf. fulva]|nr:MAG: hypothetical protein L6R40_003529 [Xanthomendoza cf. fulva]
MSFTQATPRVHPQEPEAFQPRKRFKSSELPLNATQRSTIDGLLHTIKKKGEYDTLRKTVYSRFEDSDAKIDLINRLNELADAEIDRDPSLLSRDRRKAATLMQGAVDRSDIYKNVERCLDQLISEHLNHVLAAGRAIRKAELGAEEAAEEEKRGNITDEEYAKEAAKRREAREQQRRLDENRKRSEEEKERVKAEFKEKAAELERLRKKEMERLERGKIKQRQKEERRRREEEEVQKRKEYEQRKIGEETRQRSSHHTMEQPRSRHPSAERPEQAGNVLSPQVPEKVQDAAATTPTVPLIDEEAVEREALEKLLREGAELAAKSGIRAHVDRSDSIEPPRRRSHMLKPKSSNISPCKTAEVRQPMRSESIKPVLSFSATNTRPNEPPLTLHVQNKSPPSGPKTQSRYRSRSNSRPQWDEQRPIPASEDRLFHKPTANLRQDQDSRTYKREPETSHRSHSFAREDTREKEVRKDNYRDVAERSDRSQHHRREYDEQTHISSRRDRSHSRGLRDADKDKYKYREDERETKKLCQWPYRPLSTAW